MKRDSCRHILTDLNFKNNKAKKLKSDPSYHLLKMAGIATGSQVK